MVLVNLMTCIFVICLSQIHGKTFWTILQMNSDFTNEVRFQASVRVIKLETRKGFGKGHVCTGALITWDKVMTPAYCIHTLLGREFISIPPAEFVVVMGATNLDDKHKSISIGVRKYVFHPEFDGISNNLAVLLLNSAIPYYNPKIHPIQVPTRQYQPGNLGYLIGWGVVPIEHEPKFKALMKVRVVLLDILKCKNAHILSLAKGMICLSIISPDVNFTCLGERGGALVIASHLVGLSSWSLGCGTAKNPILYTNIYYYSNWLKEIEHNQQRNFYSYISGDSYIQCHISLIFCLLWALVMAWLEMY